MNGKPRISQYFCNFAKDTRGNFAIMTAIALPVLLGIGGAAVEITRAMQIKADMQTVADAAVLAAATEARIRDGKINEEDMIAAATAYIEASMFANEMSEEERDLFLAGTSLGASKTKTDKTEEFRISTTLQYNMQLNPLLSFIGHTSLPISVESEATSAVSAGAALSLYLVLDQSGSMSFKTDIVDKNTTSCKNYDENNWADRKNVKATKPCYISKIGSLKIAVNYLTDTLIERDPSYNTKSKPNSGFIRTAVVGFNDKVQTAQTMDWGVAATVKHVNALPTMPEGGTDAIGALTKAYNDLRTSTTSETNIHKTEGNNNFTRFILFMADGQMTGSGSNWSSSIDRSVRNICNNAKQDGITIFTVAFMANSKGQELLKDCATSTAHYYAPDKMSELVAAFGEIARKASSKISRLTK